MKDFFSRRFYIILVIFFLVIVFILLFVFKDRIFSENTNNIGQNKEAKTLTQRVGDHIFLPEGEVPTIATVSDPEALQGQTFFIDAKKGDKVLIFPNAKKAILYDPVADKIITIAPLNTGSDTNLEPTPVEDAKSIIQNNQF